MPKRVERAKEREREGRIVKQGEKDTLKVLVLGVWEYTTMARTWRRPRRACE